MTIKKYIAEGTNKNKSREIETTDLGLVKKEKSVEDITTLEANRRDEVAAIAHYEDAKKRTDDPGTAALMDHIQGEEEGHEKELQEAIGSNKEDGETLVEIDKAQKRHTRTSKTGKPFFAGKGNESYVDVADILDEFKANYAVHNQNVDNSDVDDLIEFIDREYSDSSETVKNQAIRDFEISKHDIDKGLPWDFQKRKPGKGKGKLGKESHQLHNQDKSIINFNVDEDQILETLQKEMGIDRNMANQFLRSYKFHTTVNPESVKIINRFKEQKDSQHKAPSKLESPEWREGYLRAKMGKSTLFAPMEKAMRKKPAGHKAYTRMTPTGKIATIKEKPYLKDTPVIPLEEQFPNSNIIKLESEKQDYYANILSDISQKAMNGDEKAQEFLTGIFEENWSSIQKKLKVEGSTWYVWWMNGVNKFIEENEPSPKTKDAVEVLKLKEEIDKIVPDVEWSYEFLNDTHVGGSIFGSLPVDKTPYKNSSGDLIKPKAKYIRISSGVNPNGITGKNDIARTYIVSQWISADIKRYRKHNEYEGEVNKFYDYGRDITSIVNKFNNFVSNKSMKKAYTKFPKYLRKEGNLTSPKYIYSEKDSQIKSIKETLIKVNKLNTQYKDAIALIEKVKGKRQVLLEKVKPIFDAMKKEEIETDKSIFEVKEQSKETVSWKELYVEAFKKLDNKMKAEMNGLQKLITKYNTWLTGKYIKKSSDGALTDLEKQIISTLNDILNIKKELSNIAKKMVSREVVKSMPKKLYTDNLISNRTECDADEDEDDEEEESEDLEKCRTKGKKHRKHTPIVSRKQQKLFGAALGGAKTALGDLPKSVIKEHLEESKGKKLPEKVGKKKKSILQFPMIKADGAVGMSTADGKGGDVITTGMGSYPKTRKKKKINKNVVLPYERAIKIDLLHAIKNRDTDLIKSIKEEIKKSKGPWKKGKKGSLAAQENLYEEIRHSRSDLTDVGTGDAIYGRNKKKILGSINEGHPKARTRIWLETTLRNDEASSDEELKQHFMKEGISEKVADYAISQRGYALKGEPFKILLDDELEVN